MKKLTRFSIGLIIALCLLLISVSSALACTPVVTPTSSYTWEDPETSRGTGEVLKPAELPGTETGTSGLITPAGYNGYGQFGGNGLAVSGLSANNAQLCFSFPTYRYGWEGAIKRWTGSKWVSVSGSELVAPTGEGSTYQVCTPSAGNGTYSLIIHYTGHGE